LGVPVNPLWNVVLASFQALNKTNPNLTSDCWLCYEAQPPFYEAIGLNSIYNATNSHNPPECNWRQKAAKITMRKVIGQGKCIG
ncbi:ENV2 protein, partial [Scytalopus superciliaris]|nr:ENV2 protein [Scytalopus superciliaris]